MNEESNFVPTEEQGNENNTVQESSSIFKACENSKLPTKSDFGTQLRKVLLYEIKVELTPHQQKIEDEINEFFHRQITWESVKSFLFQEISFGKSKKSA